MVHLNNPKVIIIVSVSLTQHFQPCSSVDITCLVGDKTLEHAGICRVHLFDVQHSLLVNSIPEAEELSNSTELSMNIESG